MSDKYQMKSTVSWRIPGDVPVSSPLYPVEPREDEAEYRSYYVETRSNRWRVPGDVPVSSPLYHAEPENNVAQNVRKVEFKSLRPITNYLTKNQLVKTVSQQAQTIPQHTAVFSADNKRIFVQPLAMLLLIMVGLLLSLPEFDEQIPLKGNESFAANQLLAISGDKSNNTGSDVNNVTQENNTIKITAGSTTEVSQPALLLKLTSNPAGKAKIITHIVVKGDTLWDIAKHYVNDPFRYPELAKLSNIATPDLIYPGNIIRIQT